MLRTIGGWTCGVLDDFNLSSWSTEGPDQQQLDENMAINVDHHMQWGRKDTYAMASAGEKGSLVGKGKSHKEGLSGRTGSLAAVRCIQEPLYNHLPYKNVILARCVFAKDEACEPGMERDPRPSFDNLPTMIYLNNWSTGLVKVTASLPYPIHHTSP